MITDEEISVARNVGVNVGRKWHAVEVDDLQQECILWLYENQGMVTKYRDDEGGRGKLIVALKRFALNYALREQAHANGRQVDDEYPLQVIENALPFVFEDTPVTAVPTHPLTERALVAIPEHGLATAIVTDLKGAFAAQGGDVKTLLTWRFRDGLSYEQIGDLLGISDRGAQKRVKKAVKRLYTHLGGDDV